MVPALDVPEDPLPLRLIRLPPAAGVAEAELPRRAAPECLLRGLAVRGPRRGGIAAERPGERRAHRPPAVARGLAPGENDPLENRNARVAEDQIGVHFLARAEPMAVGTDAERRVERELARLELGQREPADRTGEPLREEHRFRGGDASARTVAMAHDLDDAIGLLEGGLDRVIET